MSFTEPVETADTAVSRRGLGCKPLPVEDSPGMAGMGLVGDCEVVVSFPVLFAGDRWGNQTLGFGGVIGLLGVAMSGVGDGGGSPVTTLEENAL